MRVASLFLFGLLVGLAAARHVRREVAEVAASDKDDVQKLEEQLLQQRLLLLDALFATTTTGTTTTTTGLQNWQRFWSAILLGRPYTDSDRDGILDKWDATPFGG